MKILSKNKYEKCEVEFKINTKRKCMREVVDIEQMEEKKGDIYINDEWHYVMGQNEINFIFLDLVSYPLYGYNDEIKDTLLELDILIDKELYKIQLLLKELYDEKWLKEIKTQELLVISRSKYQKIIGEIKPRREKKICFESIGVHKVNDEYYYVVSNCAITSKGINRDIRALKEGFDLEFDENIQEEDYVKKFIEYNRMNLKIFYPIHYIQIVAVLKYFLTQYNISAGTILWIDGVIASGKTELAYTIGDIFNRCGDKNDMKRNLYSTKIKIKEIEKKLGEYQNAVFILDDVKKEETSRNRENAKNVTDLVVRSIYMGRLGRTQSEDDTVNAAAIITGEFFKEQISTITRILYLNIGKFLQEKDNSECFKKLQSDKTYFAGFMRYFIQWLFKNIEEEKQSLNLKRIIENVSGSLDREFMMYEYFTRMKELKTNMLICTKILLKYLGDILGQDNINVVEFQKESQKVINDLIRNTWLKSLNYQPIYAWAFDAVIFGLKIKDCRYGERFLRAESGKSSYGNALMSRDMRGISVDNHLRTIERFWLLRLEERYAGLLLNLGGEDILILRQGVICYQMREYIKENEKEWNIHYYPSDYTDEKIIGELANSQRIFVHKRSDGTFDRVFNYPLTEDIVCNEYEYEISDTDDVVKMVKVNLIHKNINKYFTNMEMEELETWVDVRKAVANGNYGRDYKELTKQINDALDKVNKFLDLK